MEKNIFQRLTDSVQDVVSQADKAYDGVKKVYNNAMVEDDKHENEILKNLGDSVQDLSMQLYAVKESMVYMEQHYAKALEGLNGSMKNIQSMTEEFSNRLQIIEQKIDDQSTSSNNFLQEEISSFCLTQKQIEKDLQKMGELLRLSVLNRMLDEIPNENFQKETSDDEEIKAWKEEQLKRLKPYTNDPEILKHVEWVAFDQDDLEDILHEGDTHLVYLCQNRFIFPSGMLKKKDMSYIGIGGNVEVVIKSKKEVDFKSLGITFTNVRLFDNIEIYEEYQPPKSDGDGSKEKDANDIAWYKRENVMKELVFRLYECNKTPDIHFWFGGYYCGFSYDKSIEKAQNNSLITKNDFKEKNEECICIFGFHEKENNKETHRDIALTNRAVYFRQYSVYCIPYTHIRNVWVENSRITIVSEEREFEFYIDSGSLYAKLLKLFLRIVSNYPEKFNLEEKRWLSKIRMASLGNQYIAEKFGL